MAVHGPNLHNYVLLHEAVLSFLWFCLVFFARTFCVFVFGVGNRRPEGSFWDTKMVPIQGDGGIIESNKGLVEKFNG
jgi:hypothetical protein